MKKVIIGFSFLSIFCSFLFYSCQKDPNLQEPKETNIIYNDNKNTFVFGTEAGLRSGSGERTQTVLGKKRTNPYTVKVMSEAYNNLAGTDNEVSLPKTHIYAQFCPQTVEELLELEERDLNLFDFPLEYEVITLGDFYIEYQENGPFPCYYAVVPAHYSFPNMSYTVLDDLHIAPYATDLTQEAFNLTGNTYDTPTSIAEINISNSSGESSLICLPGHPEYPQCLCGEFFDPGTDEYNDCMGINGEGGGSGGGTVNCSASNSSYPSGQIRVEDTELGWENVRNVQVILKDNWFIKDVVYTDDNGCFKVNKSYSGKAWMWVKFKNSHGKIRGDGADFELHEFLTPIKHKIGKLSGPIFNNINVDYGVPINGPGNEVTKRWNAALVLNGLQDFKTYAIEEGLLSPPELDIFLAWDRQDGFAFMSSYIGSIGVGEAISVGLLQSDFFEPFGNAALNQLSAIYAGTQAALVNILIPDVMIGTNFNNSDRTLALAFHEFAHASHYSQVGSGYWIELAKAEIAAGGWGNAASWQAGRIQVCESWATHIEHVFADKRYGTTNSLVFENNYIEAIERDFLMFGHVPVGIHQDLIDDFNGEDVIFDNVDEFTNAQLFSILESNIVTPAQYELEIINVLLPGTTNTLGEVTALFTVYGF